MNWDEIPEGLRELLEDLYQTPSANAASQVANWLDENLAQCSAVTHGGSLYDPPEYCENKTAVGHGDLCRHHDYE